MVAETVLFLLLMVASVCRKPEPPRDPQKCQNGAAGARGAGAAGAALARALRPGLWLCDGEQALRVRCAPASAWPPLQAATGQAPGPWRRGGEGLPAPHRCLPYIRWRCCVWTRLSCVSCRTLNTALLFPGHADAPPPISCTNHLCSLQADINREADEFEAQLRESRQRMEADRAAFAAWERETAAARSAGHFFKSLYQTSLRHRPAPASPATTCASGKVTCLAAGNARMAKCLGTPLRLRPHTLGLGSEEVAIAASSRSGSCCASAKGFSLPQ